jgi:prolactin regulatory element-binding protein
MSQSAMFLSKRLILVLQTVTLYGTKGPWNPEGLRSSRRGMAHVALISTDFPLYAVLAGQDGHIFVAGGGGQSRTGVPNALEIYRAFGEDDDFQCSLVSRIDVGEHAVMNSSLSRNQSHIAVGLDSKCRLMALQHSSPSSSKTLRRRTKSTSELQGIRSNEIKVEVVTERQTDFLDDGAFQKVVRFSKDDSMLATGGADASVRVWTVRVDEACLAWDPWDACNGDCVVN